MSAPASKPVRSTQPRFPGLRQFFREPLGVFGLAIVVILVLGAVFAPYLTDYAPNALDIKSRLAKPSSEHWLGADHLGRDTFTRVLYGGRVALKVAAWSISWICLSSPHALIASTGGG